MLEQGCLHLSSFVEIILEALPVVLVKVLLQEFAVLDDAERNLSGGPESTNVGLVGHEETLQIGMIAKALGIDDPFNQVLCKHVQPVLSADDWLGMKMTGGNALDLMTSSPNGMRLGTNVFSCHSKMFQTVTFQHTQETQIHWRLETLHL